MNGKTPPPAIVARTSVSSSSSPRIASCRCRGVMRLTRRSFDALPVLVNNREHQTGTKRKAEREDVGAPASSRTSAVRYSRMAEVYTAAFAPIRTLFCVRCFRYL